ncbi:TRAP transporter substrate-binding protein DctP [Anaerobacillus sp. HL2]|nr:TRAP transporter substrate-binding protein DctP [Anaerobacillus sp. HL2]
MTLVTSGPVANFAPMLGVLDMPFLFNDLDHVYSTLDGEVGNDLLAELSAAGFKGFAFWENGMRHFSNNKKEIRTPDDIKGLKMRTLENDIFVETYKALGADPTPIAFLKYIHHSNKGLLMVLDFSVGVFESTKQYEVQSHFSQAGIYYVAAVLMMNGEKFDSLPSDIQEVFVRLGKEYASTQRQITQEMEAEQIQTMKDNGVQVLEASEIDLVAFKAAVEPVYTKYEDQAGDYIERIQSKQ